MVVTRRKHSEKTPVNQGPEDIDQTFLIRPRSDGHAPKPIAQVL